MVEISLTIVWVFLPHFSLSFWDKVTIKEIGDSFGNFLKASKPREWKYLYAYIYIEFQMDKGLPNTKLLLLDCG
jgi:hypothetical protein